MVFSQTVNEKGYLKVVTGLDTVHVVIDSNTFIIKSENLISLTPGAHKIIVLHPLRHFWGHWDWQRWVTIQSGDTLFIKPELSGMITLRTEPFGANVYLNSEKIGQTPLTVLRQKLINKQLQIKKQGFDDYSLVFDPSQPNFMNIEMEKLDDIFNLQQKINQRHKKLKLRYRKLTYGFWGVSLLTGLSSIYLKNQADKHYNKYLTAGSLETMNDYYDLSKKYDNLTNVSLGVLQCCFMISFYFLMKSFE